MDTPGPNILLFYCSPTNAWEMWQSMQNISLKFKLSLIKRSENDSSVDELQQTVGKEYFWIVISNSYSSGF